MTDLNFKEFNQVERGYISVYPGSKHSDKYYMTLKKYFILCITEREFLFHTKEMLLLLIIIIII
jgi:hypothetical protein